MHCFNCGSFLTQSPYCESCGANVASYKKIVQASNACYNVALEKAKVRDLTGAIYFLNRSLRLYKGNINARNLLGLILYEVGESFEALAHWVISKNMQPDDNMADQYINSIQNNQSRLEQISQTVKKYNMAIDHVKQGNEDLAILHLKKVISTNPNYVKANQLLALLYMKSGAYDKARKSIIQALRVDTTNTKSIKYLAEIREKLAKEEETISPAERKQRRQADTRKPLSGNDVIIPPTNYKPLSSRATTILDLVIGFAVGAAVILFLIMPAKTASVRDEYKNERLSYEATITGLETELRQSEKEAEARAEIEANYEVTVKDYETLMTAMAAYYQGKYVEAADALVSISDNEAKPEKFQLEYGSIYQDAIARALQKAYEDGMNAFVYRDFENAAVLFNKCYTYDSSNGEYLYNYALCLKESGKTKKANKAFKKVISEYPNTKYAEDAAAAIQ